VELGGNESIAALQLSELNCKRRGRNWMLTKPDAEAVCGKIDGCRVLDESPWRRGARGMTFSSCATPPRLIDKIR